MAAAIAALELSDDQRSGVGEVLRLALTDAFYTLLLGLEGEAAIGGHQATYTILDEANEPIGAAGAIEAEAYRQFHEEASE